ncbi:MAG: OadG family protein [Bacteroidales bacterium]|nr:OadG family protein [Bacteroidales bacterium]
MKQVLKEIIIVAAALVLHVGVANAQMEAPADGAPLPPLMPTSLSANKICYTDNGFVVIDSIDNGIDLTMFSREDGIQRVGHYKTDTYKGRHDPQNILRPVSIQTVGDRIVFLATARDSSYLGILKVNDDPKAAIDQKLILVDAAGFACHNDAFGILPDKDELIVVGYNPTGYDINIIDICGGLDNLSAAPRTPFHYHVPKQAESIKASDPYGVGLTIVAVMVVFLALVCIALVLKGFGSIVQKVEQRKEEDPQAKRLIHAVFGTEEEVYVAIAAAIYQYQEDMHDEEDNVLTIQKVERAWTPWNAKFYNMNQYFNRKSR